MRAICDIDNFPEREQSLKIRVKQARMSGLWISIVALTYGIRGFFGVCVVLLH